MERGRSGNAAAAGAPGTQRVSSRAGIDMRMLRFVECCTMTEVFRGDTHDICLVGDADKC